MTKKRAAKKTTAVRKPAPTRRATSTRGPAIAGNVTARRDIVIGDQYNIKAHNVALRDLYQSIEQVRSPKEFVAKAQEVKAKIAEIKQDPQLPAAQQEAIDVVEGQVQQVIDEAQKPKPLAARINATLTGAKAVMDSLGSGVKSAIGLGTALAGLGQIAAKLFGG